MISINYNPTTKTLLFHNDKGKPTGGYCGGLAETRYLDLLAYLSDKVDYYSLLEIAEIQGNWLTSNPIHQDYTKRLQNQQFILGRIIEIENNKN